MQTNCPRCSNRLVLDDAKVPATAFMLKCPKCQGMVKLSGKGASQAQATTKPKTPAPALPQPSPGNGQGHATPPHPVETTKAPAVESGSAGKALIALPAETQAPMASVLGRLAFAVEVLDGEEAKLMRLQQGDFRLVATTRTGATDERSALGVLQRVPPDVRRRLFLVLVGDEFKTGEGTQAFSVLADLVLHPRDVGRAESLVAETLAERRRLYQTYWDTEDRRAEGKL